MIESLSRGVPVPRDSCMEGKRGYSSGPGWQAAAAAANKAQRTQPRSLCTIPSVAIPSLGAGPRSGDAPPLPPAAAAGPALQPVWRGTAGRYSDGTLGADQQQRVQLTSWGAAVLPAPGAAVRSTAPRVRTSPVTSDATLEAAPPAVASASPSCVLMYCIRGCVKHPRLSKPSEQMRGATPD